MTGTLPAVVDVSGGNLVLVLVVATTCAVVAGVVLL